jgi:FemAB-related protein (PEP-CTERM system-associated)
MSPSSGVQIETVEGAALQAPAIAGDWRELTVARGAFCSDLGWLHALAQGMKHDPYGLIARRKQKIVGVLPLAFIKSALFGKFLVSLPYVNTAGLVATDDEVAGALIEGAAVLADRLDVRYLELRHETEWTHTRFTHQQTEKVHMRLSLPESSDELWKQLTPKVRNQIRKGEKQDFDVRWGGLEQCGDFYKVFSRNMRDLGTPVFSRRLFEAILEQFPQQAEFCTLHADEKPVATALLVHGSHVTQVPSASALREFNSKNANMFLYWQLLCRAIGRGQPRFDFGRSSTDSNTFRFKKQWGAQPEPAIWQYYVRRGDVSDMRPESRKYRYLIKVWQHLPVGVTRWIGPPIIRGIP